MPVDFRHGVYISAFVLSVPVVCWNYWKLDWRSECEAKNGTLKPLKVVKQATEITRRDALCEKVCNCFL